jgi:hypothetical protein
MSPDALRSVNDVLTSGLVTSCSYATDPDRGVERPDCIGLASVVHGPIALCASCDLRRSAVGRGTVPRRLPDPARLVELIAAREDAARAEAALADAVSRARGAEQSWSVIGTVLGLSRQGAQQRFGRVVHGKTAPSQGGERR